MVHECDVSDSQLVKSGTEQITISEFQSVNPSSSDGNRWAVDQEKSRLEIQIIQSGKLVVGHFQTWTSDINFYPENLKTANVNVNVDIASLSLGGLRKQALSSDFLNVSGHPIATFSADEFVKTGDTSFEARGQLSLVGISKPFILPFTLTIKDNRAFVEAEVTINRLDYKIGGNGFSGDGMVGYGVIIKIFIEAELISVS